MGNLNLEEKIAELEALLYIHGEPLARKKVGQILKLGLEETEAVIAGLIEGLAHADRGLALVRDQEKIQMATKPKFHALLENFIKEELREELSPASLETLALISYFGPISRSHIDYHRGVNSSFILRTLLMRGLIDRAPDPAQPQTYQYQPSFEFLKHLGLSRQEDLPEYEKIQSLKQMQAESVVGDQVSGQPEQTAAASTSD